VRFTPGRAPTEKTTLRLSGEQNEGGSRGGEGADLISHWNRAQKPDDCGTILFALKNSTKGAHFFLLVLLLVLFKNNFQEPSIYKGYSLFINGTYHHQISVSDSLRNPQNPQSFWAGGFFIFALGFTFLAGQHLR
jgi:hypothetical protein